jgi:CDGSH-type Zn-finger protein
MEALAFAAVSLVWGGVAAYRRANPSKWVCGTGDDCPCHTSERARPPRAPKALAPAAVPVKAGDTLYLCTCGQSASFPYCDGSHRAVNAAKGTSFGPIKHAVEADDTLYLCQCGHSKNRPFCDGSHRTVHEVVKPAPAVAPAPAPAVAAPAPAPSAQPTSA